MMASGWSSDLGLSDRSVWQGEAGERVHGPLYRVAADAGHRVQNLLCETGLLCQGIEGSSALLREEEEEEEKGKKKRERNEVKGRCQTERNINRKTERKREREGVRESINPTRTESGRRLLTLSSSCTTNQEM